MNHVCRYVTDRATQARLSDLFDAVCTALQAGTIALRRDGTGRLCFLELGDIDASLHDVQLGVYPQPLPCVCPGLNGRRFLAVLVSEDVVCSPDVFAARLAVVRPQFFHEMSHVLDALRYTGRSDIFISGSQEHTDWALHDNMASEIHAHFHQYVGEFENIWTRSEGDPTCRPVLHAIASHFRVFLAQIRTPQISGTGWTRLTRPSRQRLVRRLYLYWSGRFSAA